MARNEAFFDAYAGIEIELPDGRTIRRPAPTLGKGAHLLRNVMAAQAGDGNALLYVIEEFPRAIDAEAELEGLTPAEVFDLASRFLAHRRTTMLRSPATMKTTKSSTMTNSTQGSTT